MADSTWRASPGWKDGVREVVARGQEQRRGQRSRAAGRARRRDARGGTRPEPTPNRSQGPSEPVGGPFRYHARVPSLRPFRALRYAPAIGPDLTAVVCPPYDIIPPALGVALRERDPHNAVRVELPDPEPGGEPATRYRAAARTLAEWRTAGVLVKERQPSIYIHEMTWDGSRGRTPGSRPGRVRAAAAGAVRARQRRPGTRADHDRPQGGPLPAAQGHGCQPEPRDPARGMPRRVRSRPCWTGSRRASRTWSRRPTTASATGCGPAPRPSTMRAPRRATSARCWRCWAAVR